MAIFINRHRAIAAAGKKIRFLGEKKLNANLEFCGDFAEAYLVGAEEAQGEIIARLMELPSRSVSETAGDANE